MHSRMLKGHRRHLPLFSSDEVRNPFRAVMLGVRHPCRKMEYIAHSEQLIGVTGLDAKLPLDNQCFCFEWMLMRIQKAGRFPRDRHDLIKTIPGKTICEFFARNFVHLSSFQISFTNQDQQRIHNLHAGRQKA